MSLQSTSESGISSNSSSSMSMTRFFDNNQQDNSIMNVDIVDTPSLQKISTILQENNTCVFSEDVFQLSKTHLVKYSETKNQKTGPLMSLNLAISSHYDKIKEKGFFKL
ncbi:hypothetical protein ABK040_012398 [Willaertia magna]